MMIIVKEITLNSGSRFYGKRVRHFANRGRLAGRAREMQKTAEAVKNQPLKGGLIQKYQMEERITQLEQCADYKEGLRETCRNNKIAVTVLNGLTLKRLRVVYARTLRHYQVSPEKARVSWFENQLRLFHWVLLIESFLLKLRLIQFDSQHWLSIQTYFPLKSPNIFQFEAKKLIGNDPATYSRNWLPRECQLLCAIMEDSSLQNRWNEVARRFYEMSGKCFFRTSKQCREQWFNHLDHSKKHGQWSRAQDIHILEFVLNQGRKWAQMCKEVLPERTEHMIKNRFKSLMVRGREDSASKSFSQRRLIRKILSKLRNQGDNEENICVLKKLPTYHTSQAREEGDQRQDSFIQESVRSLSRQAINAAANIQQIINQEENQQQNKQFPGNEPARPSFRTFNAETQTNLSPTVAFGNFSLLMTQQINGQSLPVFTYAPFYPNFLTILTPVVSGAPLCVNSTSSQVGQELTEK